MTLPAIDYNFNRNYFSKHKWNKLREIPLHRHNMHEIYYLYAGTVQYTVKDEVFTVTPGSLVFVEKGVEHCTKSLSINHERFCINFECTDFDDDFVEMLQKCFKHRHMKVMEKNCRQIEGIFNRIDRELTYNDKYTDKSIQAVFYELMVFFVRSISEKSLITANSMPNYIEEVIEYIKNNYQKNIALEELADAFYMNKTYFSRAFKKSVGIGVNEYINSVRVDAAADLLINTDKSITDTAFECGFNNSNYFGSVFKRIMGITPLQYRKKYTNKKK